MNNTKHNEVLLQIQEQLLETVNHLSKLKLHEIFSEEDDIDTKLLKSNRIIRYYAKYIQITEKINQRTENVISSNPTQKPKNEDKKTKPNQKKMKNHCKFLQKLQTIKT